MITYLGKCLLIQSEKTKILVIGDLHFGYEEALNRSGVFVSREMLKETLEYLEKIFTITGNVNKTILLGDIKHTFGRILGQEWNDVLEILDYLKQKSKEIIIIQGNHDKIISPIAKKREVKVKNYIVFKEFCFLHGDKNFEKITDKKIKYWIMGHAHPAIKISDKIKTEKYKCFLVGKYKDKKIIILPSFIDYNLGSDPRENDLGLPWKFNLDQFEVKVVTEDSLDVLDFGKLKNIK